MGWKDDRWLEGWTDKEENETLYMLPFFSFKTLFPFVSVMVQSAYNLKFFFTPVSYANSVIYRLCDALMME